MAREDARGKRCTGYTNKKTRAVHVFMFLIVENYGKRDLDLPHQWF